MKPILLKTCAEVSVFEHRWSKELLPWLDDKMVVCHLFSNNNWMRAYLTKHLEEIKLEAKLKGFRFFWTDDPNGEEFADLQFRSEYSVDVHSDIQECFDRQNARMSSVFRRLDDEHIVAWEYEDMVKSSTDISFPKELYEELGSVEQYGEFVNIFQEGEVKFESDAEHFSPDPDNDEHDQYFEQFSCKCEKCGAADFYKIPKEIDFYNGMESETQCACCGKDSWEVCNYDMGYYWNLEYGGWHPCFLSIPADTGYCHECKPYYVSDIANLEILCWKCRGKMKR